MISHLEALQLTLGYICDVVWECGDTLNGKIAQDDEKRVEAAIKELESK